MIQAPGNWLNLAAAPVLFGDLADSKVPVLSRLGGTLLRGQQPNNDLGHRLIAEGHKAPSVLPVVIAAALRNMSVVTTYVVAIPLHVARARVEVAIQ